MKKYVILFPILLLSILTQGCHHCLYTTKHHMCVMADDQVYVPPKEEIEQACDYFIHYVSLWSGHTELRDKWERKLFKDVLLVLYRDPLPCGVNEKGEPQECYGLCWAEQALIHLWINDDRLYKTAFIHELMHLYLLRVEKRRDPNHIFYTRWLWVEKIDQHLKNQDLGEN